MIENKKRTQFIMDLQTFAEDEVEVATDETVEQSPKADYALDEDGKLIILDNEHSMVDTNEDSIPDDDMDGTTVKTDSKDMYSAEQIRDSDFEKLDPNKIPNELVPFYRSMQAGFTKKTQNLAEQRKSQDEDFAKKQAEIEQVLSALKQQVEQTQSPAQSSVQEDEMLSFINTLSELSSERAAKILKLNDIDDFDPELNRNHKIAFDMAKEQIFGEIQKAQAVEQEKTNHEQVLVQKAQSLQNVFGKYEQLEPSFWNQISEYAVAKLDQLPWEKSAKIREALKNADCGVVEGYIEDMRKEFHAVRQGIKPSQGTRQTPKAKVTPNTVETTETVQRSTKANQFDASKLRDMSSDEISKFLAKNYI